MKSSEAIAVQLRKEADELLFEKGIASMLQKYGEITFTGSYEFDLMAWPDVDLNLVVKEGVDPLKACAELAFAFVQWDNTVRVKFERNLHKQFPSLPDGLYLGLKLNTGTWKLPWKFDIWIVDEKERSNTLKKNKEIEDLLTHKSRITILDWKEKLMTPKGRTPSFSGHWLYQALLVHKMESEEEIYAFLREKGVKI